MLKRFNKSSKKNLRKNSKKKDSKNSKSVSKKIKKNLKGGMYWVSRIYGRQEKLGSYADIDVECTYPVEKSNAWTDRFGPRKKFSSYISSGSIEHMGRKDDTCWLDRNPAPEFLNASVQGADGGYQDIFKYGVTSDDKIILDWFQIKKGNSTPVRNYNKKKFQDITQLESKFVIRCFRRDTNKDTLARDSFFVVDETFGIVYDIISIKNKSNNEIVAGIDSSREPHERHVGWILDTNGRFDWKKKIVTVGNFVGTVNDDNPNILVCSPGNLNMSWREGRWVADTCMPGWFMPWNVNIEGYSDERTIGQLITGNEILTQVKVQLAYLRKIYELKTVGIKAALPTSAFMRSEESVSQSKENFREFGNDKK